MAVTLILTSYLFFTSFEFTVAFWWYLGEEHAPRDCFDNNKLKLTDVQKHDCTTLQNFRQAVSTGVSDGIGECGSQFASKRWNCHTNKRYPNLFGNIVNKDVSESGFIYALMSASAVHGVVNSCSDGDIYMCGCRVMDNVSDPDLPGWTWGGCSDSLNNAIVERTRRFVDSPHSARNGLSEKIKMHNNRAGYLAVKNNMKQVCKCQGLSGSCTIKTCYERMPEINDIGSHLMDKYNWATRVIEWISDNTWILYDKTDRKPKEEDIVYSSVTNMDSFCQPNEVVGSDGTADRVCQTTSIRKSDSCGNLCCGRGFIDRIVSVISDCNCQFLYHSLEMKCTKCTNNIVEKICL